MVMMKFMPCCAPKRLYMYFRAESMLHFLENHSLKMSDPTTFNDPFDCKVDYNRSMQTTGFLDIYPNAESLNERDVEDLDVKHFDRRSSYGITCFTTEADDILMWAYYAEGQKGFCVEFDPSKDINFFHDLHQVHYKDKLGCIYQKNKEWDYTDAYITKLKCWKHEKEWRVIKPYMANTFYPINPAAITSIIWGNSSMECRRSSEKDLQVYDSIISLLQQSVYKHVRIQQIQCALASPEISHADVPFLIVGCKDHTFSIVSTMEQKLCIDVCDENNLHRKQIFCKPMKKWEKYTLIEPLPVGVYVLHNGTPRIGRLRILPD